MSEATTPVVRNLDDGSIEHYAILFTPAAKRPAATAIFQFARTMRELVGVQRDVVGHKIHWWHEELQRFAQGSARHPLCVTLAPVHSAALADALNSLLHGAVMDVNEVDVTPEKTQSYLQMRGGAVHCALAAADAVAVPDAMRDPLASVCGIADLLFEARSPAFAKVPVAQLSTAQMHTDDEAREQLLRQQWQSAAAQLPPGAGATVTSAVILGLYKAWWPRIIATPYGYTPPPLSAWQKLWTAWRAARAFDARGTTS